MTLKLEFFFLLGAPTDIEKVKTGGMKTFVSRLWVDPGVDSLLDLSTH